MQPTGCRCTSALQLSTKFNATMSNLIESSYEIPSPKFTGFNPIWLLLIFGLLGTVLSVVTRTDFFLFVGAILGFLLTVVVGLVKSSRHNARRKTIWKEHNYLWYRTAFPSCTRTDGRVSCRFCGSEKSHVKNMMNRTYMRLHSCGQCGETLYFSSEDI